MADETFSYSKSIVAQKDISEGGNTAYITQLSKPIFIKGVSTKKCQNVLYSIDGMNFTEETNIENDFVLSMAVVPFQLGGAEIDSSAPGVLTKPIISKSFSYILGGRDINEDINIDSPISRAGDPYSANGAYRYLLQHLAKNEDNIEWNTGDLFNVFYAEGQDLFGGSDFITQNIIVGTSGFTHELSIVKQSDANGSILKPAITLPSDITNNAITIRESPYFFLYPEACPRPEDSDKLIIDNFWRGGGLLVSKTSATDNRAILMLYIFAVTQTQ